MIIGDDPHLSTLALLPGSHPDCLKRQIEERLAAGTADEFLILTDLWGGSVNNALLALAQDPRVHIVAGMNLNLVLQLCLSPEPLAQAIPAALAEARQGMIYGNAVPGLSANGGRTVLTRPKQPGNNKEIHRSDPEDKKKGGVTMIKMLRIDDRLLHGQEVFMWTKQLNIKGHHCGQR